MFSTAHHVSSPDTTLEATTALRFKRYELPLDQMLQMSTSSTTSPFSSIPSSSGQTIEFRVRCKSFYELTD
eukprot:8368705-Prorocentrum_lima.AAC.1